MPRKPREEMAGAINHVYARGNRKQAIYLTDVDRELYLGLLASTVVDCGWRCFSYCLMDNHVHLLVQTTEPNLGVGMHRLQGLYAQNFNVRHGLSGHVFQGRYKAKPIKTDEQLLTVARYIALNPVKAGLCALPEEWLWSSHAATVGGRERPAWLDIGGLVEHFGALERYVDFVATAA